MDTGEDGSIFAGAVVKSELQKLFTLLYSLATLNLYGSEIGLAECVEAYVVSEERFNLRLVKIDGLSFPSFRKSFVLLVSYIETMILISPRLFGYKSRR